MRRRRWCLFTVIFWVVHIIHVARRCPALSSDGVSLLAFKAAVSDDPWAFLAGWTEEDEDPCRWPGVSCVNVTGFIHPRVVGVSVSGKNLSGYIPPELGALLFLRRLNLHGNRLSGNVPPQLFNASSLRSLFLYDNFLSGPFPAAACVVPRLQILDLSQNAFSGPLPLALRGCRQLQHLLLQENRFSGEIPAGVWAEMSKLVQLDLSSNDFEGPIPPDLGELDSLGGTLNLSHNRLSGAIPSELGNLPSTVILDLRYNNLSGEIPGTGSLANQSPTAFLDNPGLCGFPLTITCDAPVGAPAAAEEEEGRRGMKAGLIAVISVADAAGVALVGLVLVCAYWKVKNQQKGRAKLGHGGAGLGRRWCLFPCGAAMAEKKDGMSSSEEEDDHGGGVEGELVAMDKGFKVELEELLRASAYVLGKGGKGIVYKVVVGDGVAVAVRRLGEGGGGKYKEFAAEVRAMGRVRHPNVVRLRAFYWAPDEKLLITDFISNGNLAAVLRAIRHYGFPSTRILRRGNAIESPKCTNLNAINYCIASRRNRKAVDGRSGQPNLSWAVRLRIARGAARGLAHLHDCSPRKLVHGDLKPSNILLDADFNPYISDFGLLRLLPLTSSAATNPTSAPSYSSTAGLFGPVPSSAQPTLLDRPNPYRAPETRAAGHPTHKSDVYSFGLVLLEILTGKQPEMPSSSAEQVAGLVRWVRKGFEEARPPSELVDPALLQEVHAREEVVAAFHVALACTETDPDVRPRMKAVSEDLDRIGSWRK
ncbi:inactive leucine-rich repeat receptor-like protein kinase [Musa troglodytarum]|uniref:non-specific serine/threonine protein kinase n=1 Tax=Musa troglodytarum TaxID=320322 RepID=A0A9E7GKC2_9LILI|nr:inactive leucine-rich repeat receptor-like protein kinase [Musa troglodytarum]